MALSIQRHEEINEELRQIRERLLAFADEIATATAPQEDYEITYKAIS